MSEPAQQYQVNGATYRPFTQEERGAELDRIHKIQEDTAAWLREFDEQDEEQLIKELQQCMRSFEYWCNRYVYTFDPRRRPSAVRFILYSYQVEAAQRIIDAIRRGEDLLIEKSRDMGASWLLVAVLTWMFLFDESFHGHLGSRKEDLVDDRGPDSLLGKADYIMERVPPWMLQGYNPQKHRKQLRVEHPATGSLITGESANPGFGRGPRKNVVVFDEFAFTESDEQIWTGIQDTSPCHIVISTPCGEVNKFARLRHSGKIDVLTFHWTQHPYKDTAWYEDACSRRTVQEIAQELNIDYRASGGRLAFPRLQDENFLSRIIIPQQSPEQVTQEGWTIYAGMDWGTTNPSCWYPVGFRQLAPRVMEVRVMWEFYKPSTLEETAHVITSSPWAPLVRQTFADPSMWYYNQNNKDGVTSLAFLFRDLYNVYISPGVRGDAAMINLVADAWKDIDHIRLTISEECPHLIREWKNLQYATRTSAMTQKKNAIEALVDKDNHCFVAGTRITMGDGTWRPIEEICAGDVVLTSTGPHKVLEFLPHSTPQEIYRVYLSNGVTIDVTANHNIFTTIGKVTVDALKYGMVLFSVCQNILYSTVKSIDGMGDISPRLEGVKTGGRDFMLLCGKKLMGAFRGGHRFITKITIEKIMSFQTLRSWIGMRMLDIMPRGFPILQSEPSTQPGSCAFNIRPLLGTGVLKGKSGIANMQKNHGKREKILQSQKHVNFVVGAMKRIALRSLSFVMQIATKLCNDLDVRVIGVAPLGIKKEVYDLSVEHTHNYYANGILVSNSFDAIKYVYNAYLQLSMQTPVAPETPRYGYDALTVDLAEVRRQKLARLGKRPQHSRFM